MRALEARATLPTAPASLAKNTPQHGQAGWGAGFTRKLWRRAFFRTLSPALYQCSLPEHRPRYVTPGIPSSARYDTNSNNSLCTFTARNVRGHLGWWPSSMALFPVSGYLFFGLLGDEPPCVPTAVGTEESDSLGLRHTRVPASPGGKCMINFRKWYNIRCEYSMDILVCTVTVGAHGDAFLHQRWRPDSTKGAPTSDRKVCSEFS